MWFAGEARASRRAKRFPAAAKFVVDGEVTDGDAVDDDNGGCVGCGTRMDDGESPQAAPKLLM